MRRFWSTTLSNTASLCFFVLFSLYLPEVGIAQERGLNVVAQQVTGRADFDIGRQYAVIIGIDRYKEWPALRSAVSEAKSIRKVLADRYYIDEFFELYDGDATASNIRRLFVDTLPKKVGARDSLLVFYAGHGSLDATKTGFWIAVDGTTDVYSQDKWIPNSQLRNMIGGLKAQRILILADACFSGDFLNVSRGASPVIDSAFYRKALQLTARQVLTSGASETVPDESEYGKQLLNILERNDQSLLDPVSMYERLRLGVKQTLPLFGTMPGNEDGASFVLFLRSGGSSAGSGAAPAATTSFSGAKPADLMVKASETGADVLVDGVAKGKVPLLVSALPSGRSLHIELRSDTSAGALDVTLNPGELREVTIAMATRTGHLVITSNESAVRLLLDGVDKGPLGSGIFRDLQVGSHRLELQGQDLYYSTTVAIPPEATAQLAAQVKPVGSLALAIPAEASVTISGGGQSRTQKGPAVLANLPAGTYNLSAGGADWIPVSAKVELAQGQKVAWEPWKDGSIAFSVNPSDTVCVLEGGQSLETGRPAAGIAPGNYTALLKRPGYHDRPITVAVALGKQTKVAASLERLAPGTIKTTALSTALRLKIEGQSLDGTVDPDGNLCFSQIPTGYPVTVAFECPDAVALDLPAVKLNLAEGETARLDIPNGRLVLPWIASGATIKIGDTSLAATASKIWTSGFLPTGTYHVEISGAVAHAADVQVRADMLTEIPGYRDVASKTLISLRGKSSTTLSGRRTQSTLGIISLAAGALSAAGAGVSYYLGSQALLAYKSAVDATAISVARSQAELFSTVMSGTAIAGGIGLGLGPILLFTGPDPAMLQRGIDTLDEQLKALGK